MTLGKGLPVRTPSCLCGCDEVVWGLHSPTSAAFFDIPQASSSRPTDSLPGQPVRTVVTDLCLQATLWVSGLHETFSSDPLKAERVLGSLPHPKPQDLTTTWLSLKGGREPRLTIFRSLEEMGQAGSDTPISIPCGKPPLRRKWRLLTWIFPWLRKRHDSCYLLRSRVWGVARVT